MRNDAVRVAVDTGGTFTDCVWIEDGALKTLKVFSTSDDPSRAIEQAVRSAVGERPFVLLHGTTVGTNALLERKGARTALITTAGFEDAIEIGRQARPKLYDFFADRPAPLVGSQLRFGAQERVAADGSAVVALSGLHELVARVRAARPEAIAVSLLFSFVHSDHERQIAEALGELGIPISVSHEILPEFREYERTSTVVINAYLQPLMGRYLESLQAKLGRERARVFVMQSSGGIAPLQSVAREPVRTILSGPAGGLVGTFAMAQASGFERVIAFDMGGTSTDVALIDGKLRTTSEGEIIGLPVRVPMLDIHTVGAGGGSIARFDAAGALRVGPESAGADPGPICYGRGTLPTVTDANVLLGRLRPENFLGGNFHLDVERTGALTREWLDKHACAWSLEQFAEGVLRVVNANMEKAIRAVSIERGYDPREFTLVAFGGAGALHACELARSLQVPRVLVPQAPGALSAFGILVSDVVKEFSRTVMHTRQRSAEVQTAAAELQGRAMAAFAAEGWDEHSLVTTASLDVRYRGQGFELNVPYERTLDGAIEDFHAQHKRAYGYSDEGRAVEIVNVRMRAVLPTKLPELKWAAGPEQTNRYVAPVYFEGKALQTVVVSRGSLQKHQRMAGPAVITEYSATTVVPPGATAALDDAGNVVIEVAADPQTHSSS